MSSGEEASSPGYAWVVRTTARAITSSITALTSDMDPAPGHVTHSADSSTDYYEDFAEDGDAGQESNASLVGVSILAGALGVILGGLFIRWCVRKARDRRNRGSLSQLTVVSVGESRGNQSGILAADWRDQLHPTASLS